MQKIKIAEITLNINLIKFRFVYFVNNLTHANLRNSYLVNFRYCFKNVHSIKAPNLLDLLPLAILIVSNFVKLGFLKW